MTHGTSFEVHPSNQTAPNNPIDRPPACDHVIDNGAGITWHCVNPPHANVTPGAHYMVRDEVAIARLRREHRDV